MPRIQLENRLGVTLQRLLFTGRAYTVEPPPTIPPNALVFWQTDDSGAVTYRASSQDATATTSATPLGTAPDTVTPSTFNSSPVTVPQAPEMLTSTASSSDRQFTLTWQFTLTGKPSYQTQNVDASLRVVLRERPDGALYTVSMRRRRRAPSTRRSHRAVLVVTSVAAVFLLATASAAAYGLSGGRIFRLGDSATKAVPTATWTPVPTPTFTPTPTLTPVPLSLVITVRPNTVNVTPGAQGPVSTTCQSGESVVGGGFSTTNQLIVATDSYPLNATTWTADIYDASEVSGQATVFAVCAQANFSLGIQVLASQPSSDGRAQVTCSDGTQVIAGGAAVSGFGYVNQSYPGANGWSATVPSNGSGGPPPLTAYAVCTSSANLKITDVVTGFTVAPNSQATESASCPSSSALVAAGYNYQGGLTTVPLASQPQGLQASSWTLSVKNNDSSTPSNEGLILACLTY